MQQGWVKIHRKILENPIFKKPTYLSVWLFLLLRANHKEEKFMWNKDIIIVKEGQILTGRDKISEATGIPTSTIEDILTYLEKSQHQIQQQKTTKFRLITIVNWKEYQNSDTKSNNKATTKQQQTDTYKNDKKEKNDKNIAEQSSALIPELIKLFEGINPACKRMYGNITQRKACQDLIDTYGFDEISKVITFLPKNNSTAFKPKANTPLQLWDKYQSIKDAWVQEKNKKLSNVRGLEI